MFGLFSDGEALGSFPQWLAARAREREEESLLSNGEMKVSCSLGRTKFTLVSQNLQRRVVRSGFR